MDDPKACRFVIELIKSNEKIRPLAKTDKDGEH